MPTPNHPTTKYPPFILLLPYTPDHPACSALWKYIDAQEAASRASNSFILSVMDPITEMPRTITVRCISGGTLDLDFTTTAQELSLDHSGHPCNVVRPPCLGKDDTPPRQPEVPAPQPTKENLWTHIRSLIHQSRQAVAMIIPGNESSPEQDTEIPVVKNYRLSRQITSDLRAYQVNVLTHSPEKEGVIFCVELVFGRCGRGENILSFHCPGGDQDGLIVDIQ